MILFYFIILYAFWWYWKKLYIWKIIVRSKILRESNSAMWIDQKILAFFFSGADCVEKGKGRYGKMACEVSLCTGVWIFSGLTLLKQDGPIRRRETGCGAREGLPSGMVLGKGKRSTEKHTEGEIGLDFGLGFGLVLWVTCVDRVILVIWVIYIYVCIYGE